MLSDLVFLAQALAPDQNQQVFNEHTLTPLVEALIDYISQYANKQSVRKGWWVLL